MPSFYAIKTFGSWLKENKSMFKHPPKIDKKGKSWFTANFVGISKKIYLFVSRYGFIEVRCKYSKYKSYDILTDLDIFNKRTSNGKYYCSECLKEYQKLYNSRKDLWVKHSFEPLAEWLNENFITENCLVFTDFDEGSFDIRIINKEKLLKYKASSSDMKVQVVNLFI